MSEPLRSYRVTWRGDSYVQAARSRSAARYASWKAFLDAGYRADLPTFARMISIKSLEPLLSSSPAQND